MACWSGPGVDLWDCPEWKEESTVGAADAPKFFWGENLISKEI